MSEVSINHRFKFILAGDGATGKTSLLNRIKYGHFKQVYHLTIGGDVVILDLVVNKRQIRLLCWDSGGQTRFSCVRQAFYRGAHGFIIVFDVTWRVSFDAVRSWYYEILKTTPNVPWLLVGNKIDLESDRQISREEGRNLAAELGAISYIECSAKSGIRVGKPLKQLIEHMILHQGKGNSMKIIQG